ncbi:hypothetical protein [Nocardia sp. CDC160]|uniref:hypothetical protein n=1 Tax=Nocardia sp. CDC160 TaxID=3112166 RepID=UPI002DBCF233|nr:hypothetical protein [Nocardia sp. CDC160]MEC3920332.1 hypothetical protein [Nocardia sp. CDC160]
MSTADNPSTAAGSQTHSGEDRNPAARNINSRRPEPYIPFETAPADSVPAPADDGRQGRLNDKGSATAEALLAQLARELIETAPHQYQSTEAEFMAADGLVRGRIFYNLDNERRQPFEPSPAMCTTIHHLRSELATPERGPWWTLRLHLTADGSLDIDYDFGDAPLEELLPPELYLADLQEFPRVRLPAWMAAYSGHADQQLRTPRTAALQARADRVANVRPIMMKNEFPDLPLMWARWAVLAASFVAVRSEHGPRVLPAFGWFEGTNRCGSTLRILPGGRAVLSGGVWKAPELEAAYNNDGVMPNYYAGAPDWIAEPVLNQRAHSGLLSFCYWWEAGRWYRGESPPAANCTTAMPELRTVGSVAATIAAMIDRHADPTLHSAAEELVRSADERDITRDGLTAVFPSSDRFDIDGALYQLGLAGLVRTQIEPITAAQAIAHVRQYILKRRYDTTGYPLGELVADRIEVGWMVYVPVPTGAVAAGRAVFYVADDGVIEHSSSSIMPVAYMSGFTQRYRQRAILRREAGFTPSSD